MCPSLLRHAPFLLSLSLCLIGHPGRFLPLGLSPVWMSLTGTHTHIHIHTHTRRCGTRNRVSQARKARRLPPLPGAAPVERLCSCVDSNRRHGFSVFQRACPPARSPFSCNVVGCVSGGGGAAGESREADASAPECNATSRSSQFGEAALAMLIGALGDRSAPVAGVGELSTRGQGPRLFKDLDGGMVEISKSLGLGVNAASGDPNHGIVGRGPLRED